MVLLIIIPMKNGYFIGNINPTFSVTKPYGFLDNRSLWLDLPESWPRNLSEDMSRYALDVLGSAMLGQGFGAIDGKFDDTYRRGTAGEFV